MKAACQKTVPRSRALRVARLLKESMSYYSEVMHSLALGSAKTVADAEGKTVRVIGDDYDHLLGVSSAYSSAMTLLFLVDRQPWTACLRGKRVVFCQDKAIRACLHSILDLSSSDAVDALMSSVELSPVFPVLQQFRDEFNNRTPGYSALGGRYSNVGNLVLSPVGEAPDRTVLLHHAECQAVQWLREKLCVPAFWDEFSQWGKQINRNAKRGVAHFTQLIEYYGCLTVISLKLGYQESSDVGECVARVFDDVDKFFTNHQRNQIFEPMVGYAVAIELGVKIRPCVRMILYVQGEVSDVELGNSLIAHWEELASPNGHGLNLNQLVTPRQNQKNAVIRADDQAKRASFLARSLSCMTGSLGGVHLQLPQEEKTRKLFRLSLFRPMTHPDRQRAKRGDVSKKSESVNPTTARAMP